MKIIDYLLKKGEILLHADKHVVTKVTSIVNELYEKNLYFQVFVTANNLILIQLLSPNAKIKFSCELATMYFENLATGMESLKTKNLVPPTQEEILELTAILGRDPQLWIEI